ncbi:eight-cysteine-cluster domain-containing protein [Candidatus Woesearchaeota archaeon]|nr:eight-cysteine-cluster domain-containing protein [Candidatus Woesearchaeota archaeon]
MKHAPTFLIMTIITAAILIIAACTPLQPQENKTRNDTQLQPECSTDSDCGVGGCSGQVCTTAAEAEGLITTCEYRAEYDCLKLTSCGCVEGRCGWIENPVFEKCLQESRGKKAVY